MPQASEMSIKYRGDSDDMYVVAMQEWQGMVRSQGKFMMAAIIDKINSVLGVLNGGFLGCYVQGESRF